jgi:hypothetical protein
MKKSHYKFLKIVDEKHDINFHWPKYVIIILKVCASVSSGNLRSVGMQLPENYQQKFDVSSEARHILRNLQWWAKIYGRAPASRWSSSEY